MIFAPRSCPSRPGFAITTRILRATGWSLVMLLTGLLEAHGQRGPRDRHPKILREVRARRACGLAGAPSFAERDHEGTTKPDCKTCHLELRAEELLPHGLDSEDGSLAPDARARSACPRSGPVEGVWGNRGVPQGVRTPASHA